jgi:hypothetical protein
MRDEHFPAQQEMELGQHHKPDFTPRNARVQAEKDPELSRALRAQTTLPGCRQNIDD